MDELKTNLRLVDKDSLLNKYKSQHKGPPGKAFDIINDEPPVEMWMRFDEVMRLRAEYCSLHRCSSCEFGEYCGNRQEEAENADVLEQMLIKWKQAKEAPPIEITSGKTYLEDFLEHYPNARKTKEGAPYSVCRKALYNEDLGCIDDEKCIDCWKCYMPEAK